MEILKMYLYFMTIVLNNCKDSKKLPFHRYLLSKFFVIAHILHAACAFSAHMFVSYRLILRKNTHNQNNKSKHL